jgi:probable rRNA maturation factor
MPGRARARMRRSVAVPASIGSPAARRSAIAVELLGARTLGAGAPARATLHRWARAAALACGVREGHLSVHFVTPERIAELNRVHRGKPRPTDVLAFPIDGGAPQQWARGDAPPIELGDVFICEQYAADLLEVLVHGVLHLCGMDHERDHGEMLARQDLLLRRRRERRAR